MTDQALAYTEEVRRLSMPRRPVGPPNTRRRPGSPGDWRSFPARPASMEDDVQLAKGGSALDYEIIGVDTVHATPQNPLAEGSLYR